MSIEVGGFQEAIKSVLNPAATSRRAPLDQVIDLVYTQKRGKGLLSSGG